MIQNPFCSPFHGCYFPAICMWALKNRSKLLTGSKITGSQKGIFHHFQENAFITILRSRAMLGMFSFKERKYTNILITFSINIIT